MDSRFSPGWVAAFELFFRPWMRSRVHAVRFSGLPAALPRDLPLLVAANHVSWWDAFVLRELQRTLRPGAPFHTLMAERELARFPLFRRLGVVGIDAGSPGSVRAAVESLRAALARRPDAVVAIFPQGRIAPAFRRPLGFRRGVELLSRRLPVVTLPVAIHPEPLATVSPTFFVSVAPPREGPVRVGAVERAVEGELDAVAAFLAAHGEDAGACWPSSEARVR